MQRRKLVLEFTKMNGAGNDFIVIDNRFYHFSDEELTRLARRWCPRRLGIGADGLLAFAVPEEERHDFRMRYFNADGSRATMCGNGARCLARFARLAGLTADELTFETDAGLYRAAVPDGGSVRLFVDPPRDLQPNVALDRTVSVGPFHYIWTGTEHVVCFVDNTAEAPVATVGPVVRADAALAPHGANVNFVEVLDAATVRVRTFEKGVEEETPACGTGALAAAIMAWHLDHLTRVPVAVHMPGGTLQVGFQPDRDTLRDVYLEGPAEEVFRGTVEVDP